MPLDDDPSLKLTWRLENFSTSASLMDNFQTCPTTGIIPLLELGGTKWQIDLCPSTDDEWVVCSFARSMEDDEEEDVSFAYSVYILGRGGAKLFEVGGTALNCAPFTSKLVNVIRTEALPPEWVVDDSLHFMIKVKQLRQDGPVDVTRSFWRDELENLSRDMRRLFEGKYRTDFRLKTDDNWRIGTHKFMLSARWPLLADILSENPNESVLHVRHVSGPILTSFMRYLYTGQVRASEVTSELFDFVIEQTPKGRDKFYTLFTDMAVSTQQVKDRLAFTWVLQDSDGSVPDCFRVLPMSNMTDVDLLVEISSDGTDDPKLVVRFSLCGHPPNRSVFLQCSATFLVNDYIAGSVSDSCCLYESSTWRLPDFAPMRLLATGPARRRIEFDLEIKHKSFANRVENTVTEFHTGSRDVWNVLLLSNDLFLNLAGQQTQRNGISDVVLRTADSELYSCGALLGVRSRFLRRQIRHRDAGGRVELDFPNTTRKVLTSVLEYLHTGWTLVQTRDEALVIHSIAEQLRLRSLVDKCRQCFRILCSRVYNN